jgi:hypothetical protein
MKILLLLVTSLAVIHRVIAAEAEQGKNGGISFKDAADETEAIREKIRSEMGNYKKIKEMMLKNKLSRTVTTVATTTMEMSTVKAEDPMSETISTSNEPLILETPVAEIQPQSPPEDLTPPAASTAPATPSSTVRPVVLFVGSDDDEEAENSTSETNHDDTTISPNKGNPSSMIVVDDRFILNAPVICKAGRMPDSSGICRKVI